MAKRNNSKKTSCSNFGITGCSPQCPFFPNTEGEIPWHFGKDGLKYRDDPVMKCGYNGSLITSWNRICPWKEEENLLLEKKEQEKTLEIKETTKKKSDKKRKFFKKRNPKNKMGD